MPGFSTSLHIAARSELVFDLFTDLAHAAQRIRGIQSVEVLTPGEIGVGTRFRETRTLFGKQSTEELEITEFVPGHRYTVEAESCGAHYRATFEFQPDIWGTTVTVHTVCRPISRMAKLMSPLSWLMLRPMRKLVIADMNDLKEAAESLERHTAQTAP